MKKIYAYKCSSCDHVYEFFHVQTYRSCTICEWKGELRLQSIEILENNKTKENDGNKGQNPE